MNYENSFITGFCLLPSYICGGLLLARGSVVVWLIGMVALLLITSVVYNLSVLTPIKAKLKQGQRYWMTFIGQIALWSGVIFVLTG